MRNILNTISKANSFIKLPIFNYNLSNNFSTGRPEILQPVKLSEDKTISKKHATINKIAHLLRKHETFPQQELDYFVKNEDYYWQEIADLSKKNIEEMNSHEIKSLCYQISLNLFCLIISTAKISKFSLLNIHLKPLNPDYTCLLHANACISDYFLIIFKGFGQIASQKMILREKSSILKDIISLVWKMYIKENVLAQFSNELLNNKEIAHKKAELHLNFLTQFFLTICKGSKYWDKNNFIESLPDFTKNLASVLIYFGELFSLNYTFHELNYVNYFIILDSANMTTSVTNHEIFNYGIVKALHQLTDFLKYPSFKLSKANTISLIIHLSRLDVFGKIPGHFTQFYSKFIFYLDNFLDSMTENDFPMLLYSNAKLGHLTPKFQNKLIYFLENIDSPNTIFQTFNSTKSLYNAASLYLLLNEYRHELMEKKIMQYYTLYKSNPDQSNFLENFAQIIRQLTKLRYWDSRLWDIFFDELPSLLKLPSKFSIFFALTCFNSFKDEVKSKTMLTKLESALENYKEFLQTSFSVFFSELNKQGKKLSTFEIQVEDLIVRSGIQFQREVIISPYIVDFYLPEYNLIIESMGPFHYIKPSMELNLHTHFKNSILTKLGYNCIFIPPDIPNIHQYLETNLNNIAKNKLQIQ